MIKSTNQTPSYYTASNGKEVMDYIMEYDLGFLRGNALKYVTRAEKKGDFKKDLFKAFDYLNYYQQIDHSNVLTAENLSSSKMDLKSDEYKALKTDILYENVFDVEKFFLRVVILDILSGYTGAALALLRDEIN